MSSIGITLLREIRISGWQMAIGILQHRLHPSHIWLWPQNLQMFVARQAEVEELTNPQHIK